MFTILLSAMIWKSSKVADPGLGRVVVTLDEGESWDAVKLVLGDVLRALSAVDEFDANEPIGSDKLDFEVGDVVEEVGKGATEVEFKVLPPWARRERDLCSV